MTKPIVDIVITSYNGRHLLEKHLPKVIANSPQVSKIIIVDDSSIDDGTNQFITQNYPQTTYFKNPHNLGFPQTTNRGIALSSADFVVLLNNDVSPHPNYISKALSYFVDHQLFAVTFNEINSSWPQVSWHDGKLQFINGTDKTKPHYSCWPSGGSSIVRRSQWVALGGYDTKYSPGYWEDIDLGWRAWKRGLKIIWSPDVLVDHQHESTFKKLNPNFISRIRQRNELFFNWQNITDSSLFRDHIQFLFNYSLTHPGYIRILLSTLPFMPQLINQRRLNHSKAQFTDQQIISLVNQPLHS